MTLESREVLASVSNCWDVYLPFDLPHKERNQFRPYVRLWPQSLCDLRLHLPCQRLVHLLKRRHLLRGTPTTTRMSGRMVLHRAGRRLSDQRSFTPQRKSHLHGPHHQRLGSTIHRRILHKTNLALEVAAQWETSTCLVCQPRRTQVPGRGRTGHPLACSLVAPGLSGAS